MPSTSTRPAGADSAATRPRAPEERPCPLLRPGGCSVTPAGDASAPLLLAIGPSSPQSIILTDADGIIQYANSQARSTLGRLRAYLPFGADDPIGQPINILRDDQDSQCRLLSHSSPLPQMAMADIGPQKVKLTLSPLRSQDGEHLGAMVTLEVVTELVAQEEAVRATAEMERARSKELEDKVDAILAVVERAAQGDLRLQIPVDGTDAIGRLGEGLDAFIESVRAKLEEVGQFSRRLREAATAMAKHLASMRENAVQTSSFVKASGLSSSQLTQGTGVVATAVEELNASIAEIGKNAAEAAQVGSRAVGEARMVDVRVARLGESSADIGKVVRVITSIAQQTNLLALNAAIEAARAGSAGRGFAVVASEVKELANETAKAMGEISERVEAIQRDTISAAEGVRGISAIISRINAAQITMASAVDQQTAATSEIGTNITRASEQTEAISSSIDAVACAADETRRIADAASSLSRDVSALGDGLMRVVNSFLV